MVILAACEPVVEQTPFAATLPPSPVSVIVEPSVVPTIAVPTETPTETSTPTDTLTPTETPTATLTVMLFPTNTVEPSITPTDQYSKTPTATLTLTAVPTETSTPTLTITPTVEQAAVQVDSANPLYMGNATWTPPPNDPAAFIDDHYQFARALPEHATTWAARNYAYGSTNGRQLQAHHGLDFVNPRSTAVLAAADGMVVYAGDDLSILFGPETNYYGNLVVIQHNFTADSGRPVFSLYGHLEKVDTQMGAVVSKGDRIGFVGDSGIALGPHLHFEVRIGDFYQFSATRNPDLWIFPYYGFGTLAGRITDASGARLFEAPIQIRSSEGIYNTVSYANVPTINPDTAFGENYTRGDLPAGYYQVSVNDGGRVRFQQNVYVYPNRTTWLDIVLN